MEPFLSEIRIFSFIYAPRGWALCNGQLLPINQNQALFSLLGTTYGGNGQTTFALPDLRGRTQLHFDGSHTLGERSGEETHALSAAELPTHTHALNASTTQASTNVPANNTVLSASNPQNVYGQASNPVAMDPSAIGNSGGSQPHTNQQPFLTLSFCIALQGIFPSHT